MRQGEPQDAAADAAREATRLAKLRALLVPLAERNPFYRPRLAAAGIDPARTSFAELSARLAPTTKDELARDQATHPPYGTNLTFELEAYSRFHRTSSTTGRPLVWLDRDEDWRWMVEAWKDVWRGAELERGERVVFAFSFGPFIGFWLGFEAAAAMGALVLSGGGMDTRGRLDLVREHGVRVVCGTPTYCLRLGEAGRAAGIDPARLGVRALVVAGEPGGSVPEVRARLSELWGGARVHDHYGMTEVGPVTYQCAVRADAVHVIDEHYWIEVVDPASGAPLAPDADGLGELLVTPLGRVGAPLLRYRTGDLVRAPRVETCACGRRGRMLVGGIVARVDQMVVVRGVNLYPSAIDRIVQQHGRIAEYQVEVGVRDAMKEVRVLFEPAEPDADVEALCRSLEESFRRAFQLRIPAVAVAAGALPRFDLKAKRWNAV